jgi:4-hydroxy-tetrahydrodipicolinate synthase
MQNLKGVYVALATPTDKNGDIDLKTLESFVDYLITDGGVQGIIPLGSTGEYYALNDSEKNDITRVVLETAAKRVPVLIGTNSGGTREVIRLSQSAQNAGAQGVLLAPPYYSLPTRAELYDHFKTVNNAIDLPIMLYNYPARTGVDLTPDLVEELADLKNVAYVKESTGESARVSEIIQRCGDKIDVFCGSDGIAFESLMLGSVGWVAGVANVIPREHVKLYNLAVEQKNIPEARKLAYKMLPLLSFYEGSGKYTQFVKEGCALKGHALGSPRKPLLPVSAEESKSLEQLLQKLDS